MPENGWKYNEEMLTENKTIYIHQSNIDVYKAMATDEYLLQSVSAGKYSTAIHVYSWLQPCITLGRFTPSDILKKPCSIDVTRRITGGNILYHENDIAYSVVIKLDDNNLEDEVSKFLEGFKMIYCNMQNIPLRGFPDL